MRTDRLLKMAEPYLRRNDLGVSHTERVLEISQKYFQRPAGKNEFVDVIAILHDIGGPSIKEQYENGPKIGRRLLEILQFSEEEIQEVCEIIRTHHNRVENPTEEFAILYDSDQMAKLTPEEFPIYEKEKTNWEEIIRNMYHQSSISIANEWLKKRRNNNGR